MGASFIGLGHTFRSLLSSWSSSGPLMSCLMKISLYSARQSISNQTATSSTPHVFTARRTHTITLMHNHRKRWEMTVTVIPGMLRAAHVSLFLLFLSFLNLGTRRNFALRLRLEKSDSWPCMQTHVNTLEYSRAVQYF